MLPARFPNLLVNGAGGIAVGMATNIPPHNLGEVIDACLAYMDNPAITIDELIADRVPAPDFPTGPLILGQAGARSAYHTGRGSIIMRCRHIDRGRPRRPPVDHPHCIPYQVGKTGLVEKDRRGRQGQADRGHQPISATNPTGSGVRIVIDLKRDATPEVVLNQLWRHTPGQSRAFRPICWRSAAAAPKC